MFFVPEKELTYAYNYKLLVIKQLVYFHTH